MTTSLTTGDSRNRLDPIQESLISFFVDGVKLLGLPPSVGGIYGLLFSSREPLALDDLVNQLDISKGSASQGLRMLRQIGAVSEIAKEGERRTYFQAEQQLKQLVGGFIKQEIRPHLSSGKEKAQNLDTMIKDIDDVELKQFYEEQIQQVNRWLAKARLVLPILQKVLGE